MAGLLSAALKSGAGKDLVKELNKRLAPAVGKYSVRCGICRGNVPAQKDMHRPQHGEQILYLQDFIAEKAEGSYVWTTDGQKHLDMACGKALASLHMLCSIQKLHPILRHLVQVLVLLQLGTATPKLSRLYRTKPVNSSLHSKTSLRPLLLWYGYICLSS